LRCGFDLATRASKDAGGMITISDNGRTITVTVPLRVRKVRL
jgi:hypothetical protein